MVAVKRSQTSPINSGDDGRVTRVTAVGRDITSRKQAEEVTRQREEEVRQGQKMEAVRRLAGGIGQDLNNLL